MATVTITRDQWPELARHFQSFFAGPGVVSVDDDQLAFDGAPVVDTGPVLRRDGTSTSFMPLHGLEARWDQVRFDPEAGEITLEGGAVQYVYRIPPALSAYWLNISAAE